MQTRLTERFAGTEADTILRACVHCGFCNATCPTYLVERNELDGPRGRIYLIKQMLEGQAVSDITRHHLDRCLTCQACETTCPSGVQYHRLLDIGRGELQQRLPRRGPAKLLRTLLRHLLCRRQLVVPLLAVAGTLRRLLPAALRRQLPLRRSPISPAVGAAGRRVILVQGCVQPALSPTTNQAAQRVLGELGIAAVESAAETCCGALAHHSDGQDQALGQARRNIDAWWPQIEAGAEAIVMTASGCSNFVKDYHRLLANDPDYAARALRVSELLRDIAEVLVEEDLESLGVRASARISWHCPCTAQHGQKLEPTVTEILGRLGFEVPAVRDSHLCCGSAGSYSLFQRELGAELRRRKLDALQASAPEQIVTANIGCQAHLGAATDTPVVHWVELVARSLPSTLSK